MNDVIKFISLLMILSIAEGDKYTEDWVSLQKRPTPSWFSEAKLGVLFHCGIFTVPSAISSLFLYDLKMNSKDAINFMKNYYAPGFTYQEFARDLTAEFFDPVKWAKLAATSGAKYVLMTSKYYDGYTAWPSKYSFAWNMMDVGPNRDLLGDFKIAVENQTLNFGIYHFVLGDYHPLFLNDKKNNFTTHSYINDISLPELYEVVTKYKPKIIKSHFISNVPPSAYLKSAKFLAWLYNESPVKSSVVVNDQWGSDLNKDYGDYFIEINKIPTQLPRKNWENIIELDTGALTYKRNSKIGKYMTIESIITNLVKTVSFGGNLLLSIGPTKEGTIIPIYQERLKQLGQWMRINGEAIHKTVPWKVQYEQKSNIWYTASNGNSKIRYVYAIFLNWPADSKIKLKSITSSLQNTPSVKLLGNGKVNVNILNEFLVVDLPDLATVKSQWAWVLKIRM